MKNAIIALTVLVAVATPSVAADSLQLLAQISHIQASEATQDLRSIGVKVQSELQKPNAPKKRLK